MSGELHVTYGEDIDPDRCLAILAEAYGREQFTPEWFEWKHRRGPWGPSRASLVSSDDGDLGVVFALPWTYRAGAQPIEGCRLVDGGTLPAARRRGVFGTMCGRELREWDEGPRRGIVLATATPAAQGSHVKNGAVALPPIRYRLGVPRTVRMGRLVTGDGVIDGYVPSSDPRLGSDWTPEGIRWRTDERSGNRYEAASLASAEEPNGLIYRVGKLGPVRVVIPLLGWGSERELAVLLASCMRAAKAPLAFAPAGVGAAKLPGHWAVPRDEVLVCVWDHHATTGGQALEVGGWRLGCAEVEGLI